MAGVRAGALTGAALCAAILTGACDDGRARLVVRTDLPRDLRDAVEASFEAVAPDIDVRFDVEGTGETVEEVEARAAGGAPPDFDVWWGAPALELERAARAGFLAAPGEGERPWRPLLADPFVVAFDRNRVNLPEAPRDWIDVFHHGWFEEVSVPDPTRASAFAGFVGAVVAEEIRAGVPPYVGFEWLERLDRQVGAYARDEREALRAVETERALLAVVRRSVAEAARDDEDALWFRVPESGTPVDVLGAGALAGTDRPDAAARFLDHLASAEVAALIHDRSRLEPISVQDPDAPIAGAADGGWTGYPLATPLVADSLSVWLERWTSEVRGRGK